MRFSYYWPIVDWNCMEIIASYSEYPLAPPNNGQQVHAICSLSAFYCIILILFIFATYQAGKQKKKLNNQIALYIFRIWNGNRVRWFNPTSVSWKNAFNLFGYEWWWSFSTYFYSLFPFIWGRNSVFFQQFKAGWQIKITLSLLGKNKYCILQSLLHVT